MYSRLFTPPSRQSYFLLGPRGTGKSSFVRLLYPDCLYFDLLRGDLYQEFLASPERLAERIPDQYDGFVVIDEIQKVPALLDEVHRLIEGRKLRFVLTGSSARKFRTSVSNLLAGRALYCRMYPLTASELKGDFDLNKSLQYGHLPAVFTAENPQKFLHSYVLAYLKEEIQTQALTQNLPAFSRFLQAASFSQASPLVISSVARECSVERKVVENYFTILSDTLLSYEIPVFAKRAKRKLLLKNKFYFFDVGVFRTLRPSGPLDSTSELNGAALETLVLQEMLAHKEYADWQYDIFHWRVNDQTEVDFILYGERGFKAIEVKAASRVRSEDFKGVRQFVKDYPQCQAYLLYTGKQSFIDNNIQVMSVGHFIQNIPKLL